MAPAVLLRSKQLSEKRGHQRHSALPQRSCSCVCVYVDYSRLSFNKTCTVTLFACRFALPIRSCAGPELHAALRDKALRAAIEQTDEDGWYVHTGQLQLTCLLLCTACRVLPTLRVKIRKDSPRSLQSMIGVPLSQMNTRVSKKRRDGEQSRVPQIEPFGLSWGMMFRGDRRLPESLICLDFEVDFNPLVIGWPRKLRQLSFGNRFNHPITCLEWPASVQKLSFGRRFDQPIAAVVWPACLRKLVFGRRFDQPITGVVWPTKLRQLGFGSHFNQPIVGVRWPASLRNLLFGREFNQPITGVVWPAKLRQLEFGSCFNHPIAEIVWPVRLRKLRLGFSFNRPIADVRWPATLQQLSFGREFNQPIANVRWPDALRKLAFGDDFDQSISGIVWPGYLEELVFGISFDFGADALVWPASLRRVAMESEWVTSRIVYSSEE